MSDIDLSDLLDLLRSKGIRAYSCSYSSGFSMRVEFGPVEVKESSSRPTVSEENCLCGHAVHQHMSGLCLMDCSPEKCAGPESKA